MRYWLDTSIGEWGIVKHQEANEVDLPASPSIMLLRRNHQGPLIMEREVFLRLYETLERLSMTPDYSPVFPTPKN